ncbi:MAG: hypothetical protein ACYTBP_01615 [Planctomycetota bacterium]|jgi:hypothetical protein
MQILKQSTQVIVRVGPFVDVGDGFTPQTDITLGGDEAELLKNGSAEVDISGRTWTAVTNCRGWYDLTLTTSDTDTVGLLTVVVQDDSDCLPVFRDFQVVEEEIYDSLFKSGATSLSTLAALTALDDKLGADTNAILEDTGTTLPATLATITKAAKSLINKAIQNKSTGAIVIYDDDGVTPLVTLTPTDSSTEITRTPS